MGITNDENMYAYESLFRHTLKHFEVVYNQSTSLDILISDLGLAIRAAALYINENVIHTKCIFHVKRAFKTRCKGYNKE